MAVSVMGMALWFAGFYAVSQIIDWMGGDPEGELAAEMAKREGFTALEQQMPLNRMRRELQEAERTQRSRARMARDVGIEAQEIELGRRVAGPRDILESVAQQLGTTPEDLGRRLSPTKFGDFSSVSKAAFGRSASRRGQ